MPVSQFLNCKTQLSPGLQSCKNEGQSVSPFRVILHPFSTRKNAKVESLVVAGGSAQYGEDELDEVLGGGRMGALAQPSPAPEAAGESAMQDG